MASNGTKTIIKIKTSYNTYNTKPHLKKRWGFSLCRTNYLLETTKHKMKHFVPEIIGGTVGLATSASYAVTSSVTSQINDQAASNYMDFGSMRMAWGVTNFASNPTATFVVPFASTPSIMFSNGVVGAASGHRQYKLLSHSATGFTLECVFDGTGNVTSGAANYVAIGLKP